MSSISSFYSTIALLQGRSVNRDMVIRSNLLIVQNLLSTEQNGLLLSKIDWLIVEENRLIVQIYTDLGHV